VLIEDADRLTEGAANALLKSSRSRRRRTVFLLCAPSVDSRGHRDHAALALPALWRW